MAEAHQIGDVISGEYSVSGSGENAGKEIAGRFGAVYVREGNDWHIAMLTGNGELKNVLVGQHATMLFPHFLADARTIGDVTYGASPPR